MRKIQKKGKPQNFAKCIVSLRGLTYARTWIKINKRIVHTYVLLTFFVMVAENRYVFRSRGITFKISSRDFSNSSFSNLSASSKTWSKCIQPGKTSNQFKTKQGYFPKKEQCKRNLRI